MKKIKKPTKFHLLDLGMEITVKVKPFPSIDLADHNKGTRVGMILSREEARQIALLLCRA